MGNCCATPSSMVWGGDDWSSLKSKCTGRETILSDRTSAVLSSSTETEKPLGTLGSSASAVSEISDGVLTGSHHGDGKVKVKISKREFEKIVESLERQQQGLSVTQILSRLINVDNNGCTSYREKGHQYDSWRSELQSIPEFT